MSRKKTTPARARRATVGERAAAIITNARGYDTDTRRAIANALIEGADDLAELVRRAEVGDTILDCRSETDTPAVTLDLAGMISAILRHPDTPGEVAEGLNDGLTTLFNNAALVGESQIECSTSPEYVGALLKYCGGGRGAE